MTFVIARQSIRIRLAKTNSNLHELTISLLNLDRASSRPESISLMHSRLLLHVRWLTEGIQAKPCGCCWHLTTFQARWMMTRMLMDEIHSIRIVSCTVWQLLFQQQLAPCESLMRIPLDRRTNEAETNS